MKTRDKWIVSVGSTLLWFGIFRDPTHGVPLGCVLLLFLGLTIIRSFR